MGSGTDTVSCVNPCLVPPEPCREHSDCKAHVKDILGRSGDTGHGLDRNMPDGIGQIPERRGEHGILLARKRRQGGMTNHMATPQMIYNICIARSATTPRFATIT